jgi:hypothetical protein
MPCILVDSRRRFGKITTLVFRVDCWSRRYVRNVGTVYQCVCGGGSHFTRPNRNFLVSFDVFDSIFWRMVGSVFKYAITNFFQILTFWKFTITLTYRSYTVIPRLTSNPDNEFFGQRRFFRCFPDSANECFSGCARWHKAANMNGRAIPGAYLFRLCVCFG